MITTEYAAAMAQQSIRRCQAIQEQQNKRQAQFYERGSNKSCKPRNTARYYTYSNDVGTSDHAYTTMTLDGEINHPSTSQPIPEAELSAISVHTDPQDTPFLETTSADQSVDEFMEAMAILPIGNPAVEPQTAMQE